MTKKNNDILEQFRRSRLLFPFVHCLPRRVPALKPIRPRVKMPPSRIVRVSLFKYRFRKRYPTSNKETRKMNLTTAITISYRNSYNVHIYCPVCL